ncbi:MAG: IS1182 family transposase [Terriglobia bacterium]
MSKQFRSCDLNQAYLLPPSLQDWLPEGHLARFVADVVETLDLSAIYAVYEEGDGRGLAAYDPRMMVRLLIYGYCRGVASSRRMERATYEDVGFRYLAADQHPDHDTIAAFRKEHLAELSQLFVQVLRLCQRAGLVKLGHVALDGTKIKANASKHRAMSYARMGEAEKQLEAEVKALLEEAARVDGEEDGKYGKGKRGDELPRELARRESRLAKIREAKAGLEGEAREQAEQEKARVEAQLKERAQKEEEQGRKMGGRPPQVPNPEEAQPEPKAQRNFTDPESRIMKDGATKEFVQAYNAQAVVDSQAQVIVVAAVTQQANDKKQLVPMLAQVAVLTGSAPQQATADAGYFSEANVTDPKLEGIDLWVAPDRPKHDCIVPAATGPPPPGSSVAEAMRHKLRTPEGRAVYRMRKAVVEPVFGQIKEGRGFRRFLLRGLVRVEAEWKLICATHNLLKLFHSGWTTQRA